MTVPSIRNIVASDPINTMCYLILNINELFCYDETTVLPCTMYVRGMSYSLRMGNPSMIRQETLDNLLRLRNLKKS